MTEHPVGTWFKRAGRCDWELWHRVCKDGAIRIGYISNEVSIDFIIERLNATETMPMGGQSDFEQSNSDDIETSPTHQTS